MKFKDILEKLKDIINNNKKDYSNDVKQITKEPLTIKLEVNDNERKY